MEAFALPAGKKAASVQATLDGAVLQTDHRMAEDRVEIRLVEKTLDDVKRDVEFARNLIT